MKDDKLIEGVLINHPRFLIRQKTKQFPKGRTGKRFHDKLKNNCTIVDKTMPGEKQGAMPSPLTQQEIMDEEPTAEESKE